MPRKPDVPCAGGCGKLLWRGTGSRTPGQMMCRLCCGHRYVPFADRRPLPSERACAHCGKAFKPYAQDARHCSPACWGAAKSELWAATRPTVCCEPGCGNAPRRKGPRCRRCEESRYPRDPERLRARWRTKNHERRVRHRVAFDQVTAQYERELRIKARCCPLCRVRMTDTPFQPASKELDHIVPLNVGGTHTVGNVRIICRACNVRRPGDGSDYSGPVTLWAVSA